MTFSDHASAPPSPVPVVDLAGSPAEMGSQHGEAHRMQITHLAELRLDYICREFGKDARDTARAAASRMEAQIERLLPDVHAEMAATARSAHVSCWELIVAGALSDVIDVVARHAPPARPPQPLNECTLTATRLPGAGDDVVLCGTWDSHAFATGSLALCRRRPTRGPATLALTTFGWPMQQGVTSDGLGFTIANLVAKRTGSGVPFVAALAHAATKRSAQDAATGVSALPHASARFYMFSDQASYVGVEIAPGRDAVIDRSVPACHTNHFLSPALLASEGRPRELDSSRRRLRRARQLVERAGSGDTPMSRLGALTDDQIVATGSGDADRTGAIFALAPTERAIYFTNDAARAPHVVHI
jgi:isopenicillin-N N-acyltransferase-like protein